MNREGPRRIHLSRTKGFNLQAHSLAINGLPCVKVDRATKWGNPFRAQDAADEFGCTAWEAAASVAMIYRDWLTMTEPERFHPDLRAARVAILADLSSLRGKNLACWCKLHVNGDSVPCHADVLLELANAPSSEDKG